MRNRKRANKRSGRTTARPRAVHHQRRRHGQRTHVLGSERIRIETASLEFRGRNRSRNQRRVHSEGWAHARRSIAEQLRTSVRNRHRQVLAIGRNVAGAGSSTRRHKAQCTAAQSPATGLIARGGTTDVHRSGQIRRHRQRKSAAQRRDHRLGHRRRGGQSYQQSTHHFHLKYPFTAIFAHSDTLLVVTKFTSPIFCNTTKSAINPKAIGTATWKSDQTTFFCSD